MANSIRVKLAPEKQVISSSPGQKVVGLKIVLTRKGDGNTKATETPQEAELVFFERPGLNDTEKVDRKIATLTGKIRLDGDRPVFDGEGKAIKYESFVRGPRTGVKKPDFSTDFFLSMTFDSGSFINMEDLQSDNKLLFLPWDFTGENKTLELGVSLQIAGATEASVESNTPMDIPLEHRGVPENGEGPQKLSYFGVGMVYPMDNTVFRDFKLKGRIPMSNKTLTINLHESVGAGLDTQKLSDLLKTIFLSAGINVSIPSPFPDDAKARAAGFAKREFKRKDMNGRGWAAANVTDLDAESLSGGISLPFFESWVFLEREMKSVNGEAGHSELLIAVDVTAGKKTLIFPIHLLGGTGNPFDTTLQQVSQSDRENFVANVIAHELGHGLGLQHGLRALTSGYSLADGSLNQTRGIVTQEHVDGGQVALKRVSPVHVAVLKRDYL